MFESTNQREYIFGSIFALSNRLQKLGDRIDDYMTMKQWILIAVISQSEKQTLTIGEAAAILGTSHQNIKKMAALLQCQGFLTLTKHPHDGRATVLSLSGQCTDYFAKRAEIEEAFLQTVFKDFDSETMEGLYHGMRRLERNIEEMEVSRTKEEREGRKQ